MSSSCSHNTAALYLSPYGETLYAGNASDNDVAVFAIGVNGTLEELERVRMRGQPFGLRATPERTVRVRDQQ